jgi:hypothetical protein
VLDLLLVAHAQLLLLDRVQLFTGGALEYERLPDPERLAVDLERLLAFDPEVVADREHLFAHLVVGSAVVTATQQWHRASSFRASV